MKIDSSYRGKAIQIHVSMLHCLRAVYESVNEFKKYFIYCYKTVLSGLVGGKCFKILPQECH